MSLLAVLIALVAWMGHPDYPGATHHGGTTADLGYAVEVPR